MFLRRITIRVLLFAATVLASGLIAATLVCFAPGFGSDERELDSRLSAASISYVRQEASADKNVLSFYRRYMAAAVHGDFGTSRLLNRPVSELVRQRLPVTFASVAYALPIAWLLALATALLIERLRTRSLDLVATVGTALILCVPTGIVGLFVLFVGGAARVALALVLFPTAFRYARNLLADCLSAPHVLAARCQGIRESRVLMLYALPSAAPQLIALAGVSISTAFGSVLAIEVFCDSPGIGQLAWQAALARDLPVLVNVTLIVTVVTLLANLASDVAVVAVARETV